MFKKFLFTVGQIYQSLLFALESVVINKLRTGLSLLGITIGIFSIITVFTLVDSMEIKIREDVNSLGTNTLYIGKWPWGPEGGEWWRYVNRPQVTFTEFDEMRELLPQAEAIAYMANFYRTVRRGTVYVDDIEIIAASYDFNQVRKIDIESGRYFTPFEADRAGRVAIIGATVAEKLFGEEDPLGKDIVILGTRLNVVGVGEKSGESMLGMGFDEQVLIPMRLAPYFANMRWTGTEMIVKGDPDGDTEEFKAEVTSIMRRLRRLPPQAEENFSVNEVSILNTQLDGMFGTINLAGGLIGIFSILVGGFGVANIMFVSVRERTSQIGIQKALGARPYFILCQFVFEAVLLSVVGGIIGLLLIFLGVLVVNSLGEFTLTLTVGNIILGLLISSAVGAIAGFFPAWSAARMEPVKAIFNT